MAVISIDYDGTFTTDPPIWLQVISLLKSAGHTVVCVTGREGTLENKAEISERVAGTEVVFCGNKAKDIHALENGYAVDIWIDDNPERCKKPFIPFAALRRIRSHHG